MATKVSVVKPQFDPARAFDHDVKSTGSPLETIAGVRAEVEVGVPRDTQYFRCSVQWGHHVTDSHLRVDSGLDGVTGEQCHAGFL